MTKVFNTPFEISLRVLLTLDAVDKRPQTVDMITVADFITIYGKDFGITDDNLHGDNSYKFCELAARRSLVTDALKSLVLDGLIVATASKKGFLYMINDNGKTFCEGLKSSYSMEYRKTAIQVQAYISNHNQGDILRLINRQSLTALREGDTHD